jgi:hypothetical protein
LNVLNRQSVIQVRIRYPTMDDAGRYRLSTGVFMRARLEFVFGSVHGQGSYKSARYMESETQPGHLTASNSQYIWYFWHFHNSGAHGIM